MENEELQKWIDLFLLNWKLFKEVAKGQNLSAKQRREIVKAAIFKKLNGFDFVEMIAESMKLYCFFNEIHEASFCFRFNYYQGFSIIYEYKSGENKYFNPKEINDFVSSFADRLKSLKRF